MSRGEIVDLGPDQLVTHIDELAGAFVAHKAQSIPELQDELRVVVAGREALKRSTYSDQCVARLLEHVEQLHNCIRQVAELSAVDGFRFALNQHEISRAVHKQLAAFAPPKG